MVVHGIHYDNSDLIFTLFNQIVKRWEEYQEASVQEDKGVQKMWGNVCFWEWINYTL